MLLWIYRILFVPALVVLTPYYLLRMRRRGGYRRHFGDRFGGFDRIPPKREGVKRIWIQAVSVGEMLAIGPLLEALAADPAIEVVLTTSTSTGMTLAEERHRRMAVAIGYFPIDVWFFSRRTWRAISPDLAVLIEGERWPEHLAQAKSRHVPIICINARLSDRSYWRLKKARGATIGLMGGITRILAGSEHDAQRFRELGFPAERVESTGNIKLDLNLPRISGGEAQSLRTSLGFVADEPVLLASSTWPGEEAAILEAFRALRTEGLPGRLLIVPRHAERRGEIEALLKGCGFSFHVRSQGEARDLVDITLADTTGELRKLTQLAEVVFVGKSLPPHHEGQTPIEAAALGKPILFGPEMSNFRPLSVQLVACGAAEVVRSPEELKRAILALWRDPQKRASMAEAAANWHRANQGALARTLVALKKELRAD